MPFSALHACGAPNCPELVPRGKARCPTHERRAEAEDRTRRGSAHQRGYDTRWQSYRESFLKVHPLCWECEKAGHITPATVVDHIVAHKGDRVRFWDPNNHRAACKPHHDARVDEGDFGRSAP